MTIIKFLAKLHWNFNYTNKLCEKQRRLSVFKWNQRKTPFIAGMLFDVAGNFSPQIQCLMLFGGRSKRFLLALRRHSHLNFRVIKINWPPPVRTCVGGREDEERKSRITRLGMDGAEVDSLLMCLLKVWITIISRRRNQLIPSLCATSPDCTIARYRFDLISSM